MTGPRLLAVGECMAELSPIADDVTFKLGFAGDTFNTAWYVARCCPAARVAYFTAVGTDRLSNDLCDFVSAAGIDDTYIQRVPDRSIGLYMTTLSKGERSFAYWRGQSAARHMIKDAAALEQAVSVSDVIYYSGITLAILDLPSRQVFFDILKRATATGKVLAFDTNLRPALWDNPKDMTETVMKAAGQCDIVLPSYEDEAQWFGDADPHATLDRYLQAGASKIVVKNSQYSVLFANGIERGEIPVCPVTDVVDTTAAGDSFNAGVLSSVISGQSLESGIRVGCDLAAQVVRKTGALVSVSTPDRPV